MASNHYCTSPLPSREGGGESEMRRVNYPHESMATPRCVRAASGQSERLSAIHDAVGGYMSVTVNGSPSHLPQGADKNATSGAPQRGARVVAGEYTDECIGFVSGEMSPDHSSGYFSTGQCRWSSVSDEAVRCGERCQRPPVGSPICDCDECSDAAVYDRRPYRRDRECVQSGVMSTRDRKIVPTMQSVGSRPLPRQHDRHMYSARETNADRAIGVSVSRDAAQHHREMAQTEAGDDELRSVAQCDGHYAYRSGVAREPFIRDHHDCCHNGDSTDTGGCRRGSRDSRLSYGAGGNDSRRGCLEEYLRRKCGWHRHRLESVRRVSASSGDCSRHRRHKDKRRVSMKPDRFNGLENFEIFLLQFENCATYNWWSACDKVALEF